MKAKGFILPLVLAFLFVALTAGVSFGAYFGLGQKSKESPKAVITSRASTSEAIPSVAPSSHVTPPKTSLQLPNKPLTEKTNSNTDLSALYLSTPATNELFLTDSLGRRVGKDPKTSRIYTEIPKSSYFLEPELANQTQENPQNPPESSGVNMLVILTPQEDIYNVTSSSSAPIDFSAYDKDGDIQVKTFNNVEAGKSTYRITYTPENNSGFAVERAIN